MAKNRRTWKKRTTTNRRNKRREMEMVANMEKKKTRPTSQFWVN